MRLCPYFVSGILFFTFTAQARFVVEQSALKIKFPTSGREANPNGFDMSLANFGAPQYGGSLVGKLVYVDPDHGLDFTCQPECKYACSDFSQARPPFKLAHTGEDADTNFIMMVDRGPTSTGEEACKFAVKVWNAQQAGAQAVIVVNYEDAHTTMEAPDEDDESSYKYLRNITIPAAFVTKSTGDALKALTAKQGTSQEEVIVVMDWTDALPRADKVEWEFWTNSNDQCGAVCDVQKEFIKEFVPVARELEKNWTRFSPHYIVWVCPRVYRQSAECQSQCIHQGRYCTPDPDGDLENGYSGADIVQENLRQLCVFQLANESGQSYRWWEYVTKFGEECTMTGNQYNEACAERVFTELNGDSWSSLSALRSCIGDIQEDRDNSIMEAEMASQRGDADTGEVFILPTIRINNGQYRGKLAYAEVLQAICAGFSYGAEPSVCMQEDTCREGSQPDTDCQSNTDGKTKCKRTIDGYECVCGDGYVPSDNGRTCLKINQCSASEADLHPDCTCERCACHDIPGSANYECLKDLEDECASSDYGGCWHQDYTVNGKTKTYSACKDNLEQYQSNAAQGRDPQSTPLHVCQCPSCFTAFAKSNGVIECVPKCDLADCDESTGVCSEAGSGKGGLALWAVLLIVVAAAAVLAAGGFAVYKYRIRTQMHQEIRAIMSQYMPLESDGTHEEKETLTGA